MSWVTDALARRGAMPRAPAAPFERKSAAFAFTPERNGEIEGYASLFGVTDSAGDRVEAGAFARSLSKRKAQGIRMLYQHLAVEPVGIWTLIAEDGRGLFVRGRLLPEVARAREVLSLMRAGALDGLSIGFKTIRARKEPGTSIRALIEIDLWEISIVTFPMLDGARVSTVKGARAAPKSANAQTP